MIELPIGIRFYFDGKLVEVVEGTYTCRSCAFYKRIFEGNDYDELECCYAVNCDCTERKDKKDVYFKEVKK